MSVDASLRCRLCQTPNPKHCYDGTWLGVTYSGYYCDRCDTYQTLGEIPAVSPEYVSLTAADLTSDHIALQTTGKAHAFDQWHRLMRRLRGGVPTGRLLDIGCGIGGFLDEAKARGLDVYGFDASPAQADNARARHPNVANLTDIDAYVATLPQGTNFDYITMWDVLEHVREPAPLLAGVRRHLAPNGLFFASVPGGGPIPMRLGVGRIVGRSPHLIPWEHVFYYSPRSLAALLRTNGLMVIDAGGVVAYRRAISMHELVRRAAFVALRNTPWAFQLYAVAKRPAS
jgi:2-polyprenyl-3-methyl-5-hydroxy-6-metoxy-1,4-benzoquinol methylase